ncbi:MAG: phosphatidylglycerophosphatase A [Thermodesulfobacteriota bacterium]
MLSNDEEVIPPRSWRSRRQLILAAATWGGVGYLPGMPGTWGSLAALPLWWLLTCLGFWGYGLALAALAAVSIPITGWAQDFLGHDHPAIVLDEVVGLLAALAWVPCQWSWVVIGFVLFRLFDIWKPLPVKYCEGLPGGWGVTLDDLAAGVLARGVLAVIMIFLGGSK